MSTNTADDVVTVRQGKSTDANFIFATWLRDLRKVDASCLPDDLFFPAWRELVSRVLERPDTVVLVVCPTDAEDEILGYIVAEPREVVWNLYVKPKFRGHGLAKKLLEAADALQAPLAWSTPESKAKIRNTRRSRQLRRLTSEPGSTSKASR